MSDKRVLSEHLMQATAKNPVIFAPHFYTASVVMRIRNNLADCSVCDTGQALHQHTGSGMSKTRRPDYFFVI
jgi:hypothetical protein